MALAALSRFWRRPAPPSPVSGGQVVYAIGDVHGRADLLARLIDVIGRDAESLALKAPPALVFLGDYVDRGADSRSVVDQVIALALARRYEVRALKGNHEQALLAFLDDASFGPTWADFGGGETLLSYGVTPPGPRGGAEAWEEARRAFDRALPQLHRSLLNGLEMMVVYGDYAFVHAGVRPGVDLDSQRDHDLLWIRDEFLQAKGPFGKVIVHGHTPAAEPYLGPFRIGIDTGAYATGVLTAIRIRDAEQVILDCVDRPS
ncbi:MAG TPA: metallophosphoesterase family protein [Caulobacteraceae bacterium]|nr:metallophosphoesterase family protein [Caulobacteraceae bacterium]